MGANYARKKRSASGLVVELTEGVVDQTRHVGEKSSIVAKERAQRLGHGEHKLSMWQLEKDLVRQMFGEKDSSFAATGRTKVEPLTRKRAEVVMSTLGVGTADPGHALEIVAAGTKPLADLLDTLKAVHAVGGDVLLIILLAEIVEVPFEDGMELVATTRNVPVLCRGRDGGCRAHINLYEQNALPA